MRIKINNEILEFLKSNIDIKYKEFSQKLLPQTDNILGVRLPILRKLAKKIYKSDWKNFLSSESTYMEEIMLKGMVIGLIEDNPNVVLSYIENFIPQICNWSICDSFCCGLKFSENNKDIVLDFILPYIKSNKEFKIRFGLVMLLNYFISETYLDKIFNIVDEFSSDKYYAQMAAAWLVSICYIKYPQETKKYLKISKLDNFTYNKSIQKIIESRKIDSKTKIFLKTLKK